MLNNYNDFKRQLEINKEFKEIATDYIRELFTIAIISTNKDVNNDRL